MPITSGHGRGVSQVQRFYVPVAGQDSGSGIVAIDGTGDVTFAVATLDALALETFTGTGDETFAGPALAASGTESFTSSGAVAFGGPSLAGSGAETVQGTGAVVFAFTLDGTGAETFTSSGAVAFAGPALDGGVPPDITGTGAIAFQAPGLDGLATGGDEAMFAGTGRRYVYPPYHPAQEFIGGIGSTRVHGPRLAGQGALGITSAGTTAISTVALDGAGVQTINGLGAVAASVALEGAGRVLTRRRLSVRASSPVRSIHGTGNLAPSSPCPLADDLVSHPAPDAIDRAWTDLQAEDDELLLLGVIA